MTKTTRRRMTRMTRRRMTGVTRMTTMTKMIREQEEDD